LRSVALGVRPLVAKAARGLLKALLPPRCLKCGEGVEAQGDLCPACWRQIDFIAEPLCEICGLPFAFGAGEGAVCGACARKRPHFDRARAVMRYDQLSRDLILAFKHADRLDAAPVFAAWLGRAGQGLLGNCDALAPVPLHRFRLLSRRYNQAAVLAIELAKRTDKPVLPDLLRRLRATPSQGGLSARERRTNVRGAFAVRHRYRDWVVGRRLLLLDDVMTTGATIEACARALKQAGAASVDALTIARVVHADACTI
jgi:ComF family protein